MGLDLSCAHARADVHGDAALRRYVRLTQFQAGWRDTWRELAPDAVLLPPQSPLAMQLRASPEWQERYRDERAVLLVPSRPRLGETRIGQD